MDNEKGKNGNKKGKTPKKEARSQFKQKIKIEFGDL